GGRSGAPPDGDRAHGSEEPRRLPVVEVLGFGHEGDAPPQHEGQEDRVREREVVAGQDDRAAGRHVLLAFGLDPEQTVEEWGEDRLEDPIRHAAEATQGISRPFLTAWSSHPYGCSR